MPSLTPELRSRTPPCAVLGGRLCTGLLEVTADLCALDSGGFWSVVLPFDDAPVCVRWASVRPARPWPGRPWSGPSRRDWSTSLDRTDYTTAVHAVRSQIAAGEVYQVNLTRRLRAPLDRVGSRYDVSALGAVLAEGNPAPYAAVIDLPDAGIFVASASPELFLARCGKRIRSSPIKGTAATADGFLAKDRAENVMIVDLVRNDLGRVCEWGSVHVPSLLAVEPHPGLFHLVSTVEGRLRAGIGWAETVAATFPPGSVTGAPKVAALGSIARLEPEPRGLYCGAIGWVDADRRIGELNVAIRTFWIEDDELNFGTGGAITWDSDPAGEWTETELKATRLLELAQGVTSYRSGSDQFHRVGQQQPS